jgi:hypothetical protein
MNTLKLVLLATVAAGSLLIGSPDDVSFDDYLRKPDQWQPQWIIQKYFQRGSPQR